VLYPAPDSDCRTAVLLLLPGQSLETRTLADTFVRMDLINHPCAIGEKTWISSAT